MAREEKGDLSKRLERALEDMQRAINENERMENDLDKSHCELVKVSNGKDALEAEVHIILCIKFSSIQVIRN